MTTELLEKLNAAYNDYHCREFESCGEIITAETKIVSLAYTCSDGEADLQVCYDLQQQKYLNYYNGELVEIPNQNVSIEAFINDLKWADFDSVMSDLLWYAAEIEEG